MMDRIECSCDQTHTVVKRMAGRMMPSAKQTVAAMMMKLRKKFQNTPGRFGRGGSRSMGPLALSLASWSRVSFLSQL